MTILCAVTCRQCQAGYCLEAAHILLRAPGCETHSGPVPAPCSCACGHSFCCHLSLHAGEKRLNRKCHSSVTDSLPCSSTYRQAGCGAAQTQAVLTALESSWSKMTKACTGLHGAGMLVHECAGGQPVWRACCSAVYSSCQHTGVLCQLLAVKALVEGTIFQAINKPGDLLFMTQLLMLHFTIIAWTSKRARYI